jgi:hypothetical protein
MLRILIGFNADPDTGIRIRIRSRVLMTKNWKKITAEKNIHFFHHKFQFYYP